MSPKGEVFCIQPKFTPEIGRLEADPEKIQKGFMTWGALMPQEAIENAQNGSPNKGLSLKKFEALELNKMHNGIKQLLQ